MQSISDSVYIEDHYLGATLGVISTAAWLGPGGRAARTGRWPRLARRIDGTRLRPGTRARLTSTRIPTAAASKARAQPRQTAGPADGCQLGAASQDSDEQNHRAATHSVGGTHQ